MMGEMEFVYELKVDANGKIKGTQKLPFGDWPIMDGKLSGNTITLTVATEFFGRIENQVVEGTVDGDTLRINPAMPPPPPGGVPGFSPPGSTGQPPSPEGRRAGSPGSGGPPGFMGISGPLVFRRGTPSPSYRGPSVDYSALPKVALPARRDLAPNGLAQTPPMGWNSWNKFHARIDDKIVRQIADAMVSSGMKAAGYQYVNIDDGWQWKRDEDGNLPPNPGFPDMKALADYIHSKGLKLGIYSSPGPRTCAGFEGSYGHEDQDAQVWAAWGIDYLKYDWCSAARVWKDEDMPAVYQKMAEALRKTGRPIVYSICQYGRFKAPEWTAAVGGNLSRTTGDIRDAWDSMAGIGFSQNDLARYAGPGHWNDPDMLEIGNGGMTATEYRTHFTLWSMLAAPLIAGNDLRNMSEEARDILLNTEVVAIDQDVLGQAARPVTKNGETEAWLRPLANGDYAISMFNRGASEARVAIKWRDLELPSHAHIRDLWAHKDLRESAGGFAATVPSHGVSFIRVSQ